MTRRITTAMPVGALIGGGTAALVHQHPRLALLIGGYLLLVAVAPRGLHAWAARVWNAQRRRDAWTGYAMKHGQADEQPATTAPSPGA